MSVREYPWAVVLHHTFPESSLPIQSHQHTRAEHLLSATHTGSLWVPQMKKHPYPTQHKPQRRSQPRSGIKQTRPAILQGVQVSSVEDTSISKAKGTRGLMERKTHLLWTWGMVGLLRHPDGTGLGTPPQSPCFPDSAFHNHKLFFNSHGESVIRRLSSYSRALP